jgi:hypothetical protein
MGKNVLIPLSILDRTIDLLIRLDVYSSDDHHLRCDYHDVLDYLVWKKQKLDLRDAYSKLVSATSQDERHEARLQYLMRKRALQLDEEYPF